MMPDEHQRIAAMLRRARLEAGLSLRELAARAGTSHATIAAYEKGAKTPGAATFLRLLEACNYGVDIRLSPRIRERNGLDRGEELEQVLRLAVSGADAEADAPSAASVTGLPEKIVAVHESLAAMGLPHAFGGALALAWCTGRARGTIDIDVNVFVGVDSVKAVVAALPDGVARLLAELRREGQVRLWWERTPVDVFLNSTDYHREVAERVRWETFLGKSLPFHCCHDLAVFKAFVLARQAAQHHIGNDRRADSRPAQQTGESDWHGSARPMDIRYINPPSGSRGEPVTERQLMWMKIPERLPDEPAVHRAALAYLSDSTLVDHVMLPLGLRWQDPDFQGASLDHAMWFHSPARADEWLLFEQTVETTGGGRGLASGRFFNRSGTLVATCLQEGLMRWSDDGSAT
jgi:transcriptional regulator with XRE-family HTH domain